MLQALDLLAGKAANMITHHIVSRHIGKRHATRETRVAFEEAVRSVLLFKKLEIDATDNVENACDTDAQAGKEIVRKDLNGGAGAVKRSQQFAPSNGYHGIALANDIDRHDPARKLGLDAEAGAIFHTDGIKNVFCTPCSKES